MIFLQKKYILLFRNLIKEKIYKLLVVLLTMFTVFQKIVCFLQKN